MMEEDGAIQEEKIIIPLWRHKLPGGVIWNGPPQ
jgi:hypothetical protein